MGFYNDQFLPRFTDVALGRPMEPTRARVAAGLSGEVLELGFGSGRNVTHLPPAVTRLYAVDPAVVGRRLAEPRIGARGVPVEFVGHDGASVGLDDESVNRVLVTWSLCTIPDVEGALREARRVLRPGGTLHFVEHGRSPKERVARWQDRLTPLWMRLFGGCHLNRPIGELIENSGFQLDRMDTSTTGPELIGFSYEGVASLGEQ